MGPTTGDGPNDWPLYGATERGAQADLAQRGLGDGLPLVVPTAAGLTQLLADWQPTPTPLQHLPPLMGELQPRAVAYQCLLAGCDRHAVPVVWAALTATLDPRFNLLGLTTTTGTPAVAVVVHGPHARRLGVNGAGNCLGAGAAANLTIGRAVSLCLRNIGGAREGLGDMATMGQPGKLSLCFAPSELSPFTGDLLTHTTDPAADAVTVLGVSGTGEVLPRAGGGTPEAILTPLAAAMAGSAAATDAGRARTDAGHLCLIPPELAQTLHGAGWTAADVRADLAARATRLSRCLAEASGGVTAELSAAQVHLLISGGAGVKMSHLPLWGGGTVPVTVIL